MSKDVDRNQVLQTTKVRTALKNDVSWIHNSKQEKGEHDQARTESTVETRPIPVENQSFVFSAAKKFESTESPLNPPLQKTAPSKGGSAQQSNIKAPPIQPDKNVEGQQEKVISKTTVENKEAHAVTPLDQSKVECSEPKVSADVKDPVAGTSAVAAVGKNKDLAEVPPQNTVQLKSKEECSSTTEPKQATCPDHAVIKSSTQPAKEACKTVLAAEMVEGEAKGVVESSPETPAVNNTTPGGNVALQHSKEPVPDTGSKSPAKSADACVKDPVAGTSAVAGAKNNNKEETSTITEPKNKTDAEVTSMTQPAKEICKTFPPNQVAVENTEAEAKVGRCSTSETPAENKTTQGGKAALQNNAGPDPVTISKSPTQPAAETTVKSADSKVKSAPEPVVKTSTEEVVKCEAKSVKNTVVKQSEASVLENETNHMVELNIKDATAPVNASEGGVVQEKLPYRPIELTDALDVVPPPDMAIPKPANDLEQSHSEAETKLNQSDDTKNTEKFPKSKEEMPPTDTLKKTRNGKAVCSFCDQIIDGNVKLIINEPPLTCHDYCLKCGVCAKALGDLLTPMYLSQQVIQCNGCFLKTLQT